MKLSRLTAFFVLTLFVAHSFGVLPTAYGAISPGQEQQRMEVSEQSQTSSSRLSSDAKEASIEVGDQNVAVSDEKTGESVTGSTASSTQGEEVMEIGSSLSESSEDVKITIKEIRIPEDAPISKYEMEALIETFVGKEVKLAELIYLTDNITQLYASARLINKLSVLKDGFDDQDNQDSESPTSFILDKITVPDNAAISQEEVEALVKPYEGKEMLLGELRSFVKNLDKIYLSSENINAIAEGDYTPMGGVVMAGKAGSGNLLGRRAAKRAQRQAENALPTEDLAFQINKIIFSGNTVISSEEIQKIVEPFQGRTMKLAEAKDVALNVTQLYRSKGYITCRAYIPPQKMSEGVLKIQIFEGKLGKIKVQGNKFFGKEQIKRYVKKLKGKVLQYADLAKDIKRTNLHPDHEVKAVIVPGKTVGTSDLILDVNDTFPLHIGAEVNNFGTKLTGKERYSVSVRHTNFFGIDDILAARMQLAEQVFAVGTQYVVPMGEYDTQVGMTFNYTDVQVGGPFTVLDLGGEAYSYSVFLNQPIYENDWLGLTWTGAFESKSINNTILNDTSSKDELRMIQTGLNVDQSDKWGRTFITNLFSFGMPWFGASDKHDPLLSRPDAGAGFFKYSGAVNRVNPIKDSTYLLLKAAGQASPDRLVSAEQFDMDGAYGVRGYPQSDYLGDSGMSGSAEIRVPFYFIPRETKAPWSDEVLWNRLNFVGFVDGGYSKLRSHAVGEVGSRSDWGVGGGVRFDLPKNLTGRFEYGVPVGDDPTDRSNGQFYFSVAGDLL